MTAPVFSARGMRRVVVHGSSATRGEKYGAEARTSIRQSIQNYSRAFLHYTNLDWASAVRYAQRYEGIVGDLAPKCLEEIRGIARGAGVDRGDILALNLRSEIIFTAGVKGVKDGRETARKEAAECSSFAVLPEVSDCGHILIGQNWDWTPYARETVMLLEAHCTDGPSYVTLVEAGLLAKVGFNESGLGVCTNTLVSTLDDGRVGLPYHVILRSLLDTESINDALRLVLSGPRAMSANYIIGHADGLAVNLETVSGGPEGVRALMPEGGLLGHSNHFLDPSLAPFDARLARSPHSLFRLDALRLGLSRALPKVSVERVQDVLRDHRNYPDAVCSHPNLRTHELERRATVASVIADLELRRLWVTAGSPCVHRYERHDYGATLRQTLTPALDQQERNSALVAGA